MEDARGALKAARKVITDKQAEVVRLYGTYIVDVTIYPTAAAAKEALAPEYGPVPLERQHFVRGPTPQRGRIQTKFVEIDNKSDRRTDDGSYRYNRLAKRTPSTGALANRPDHTYTEGATRCPLWTWDGLQYWRCGHGHDQPGIHINHDSRGADTYEQVVSAKRGGDTPKRATGPGERPLARVEFHHRTYRDIAEELGKRKSTVNELHQTAIRRVQEAGLAEELGYGEYARDGAGPEKGGA